MNAQAVYQMETDQQQAGISGATGFDQIAVPDQKPRLPYGLPVWARIMIAVVTMVVLGGIGAAVIVFGMLMMAFSMDSANSSQIPDWFEIAVMLGWPITVGAVAIIPAALFAAGAKARWPIGSFILLTAFSAIYIIVCWVGLIAAISK
ncbi:MAG: hypothetical protein AAF456_07055 [Planctomycetota bacterium]